ncbi:MAG: MFS transporter [Dehalococcoidia bacterium]|jgi:DHA1 family tetracycline resistance protein-like MFS transporter
MSFAQSGESTAPNRLQAPKLAWPLIIAISFLATIGMTIVLPVLPFVIRDYVPDSSLALWVGILASVYALCAFVAAPFLGSFSDRFGRKPILVISVFGSALGFVLFGVGGALWVLLVSRIIDGLTAGDMPVMFAYVADITPPEDRARRYGLLGALSGIGFMIGPALGGLLAHINLAAPVFATAAIAVVIGLLSALALPESLPKQDRKASLDVAQLNPFKVIAGAFARPELRSLLTGLALVSIPFAFFANNFSVVALDSVGWGPGQVGWVLSAIGVCDILVQGVLLGWALRTFGERGVALAGMLGQLAGCLGLAIVASLLSAPWLLVAAGLVLAAGQGGMTAALDGLMSASVAVDEQGWLAGSVTSLGSAVQMSAPLLAGWLYGISHGAPYWIGLVLIAAAALSLKRSTPAGAASLQPAKAAA